MKKGLFRLLGALLVIDGIMLLIFGCKHVRRRRAGSVKSIYHKAIDWLANRPLWTLCLTGAVKIGLGLSVIRKAPLSVRSMYRMVPRYYDRATPIWRDWLFRDAYVALDKALLTYVQPDSNILDLGCGTGANLERLINLGLPFRSYAGVDLSKEMLAVASKKFGHMQNAFCYHLDLMTDPLPGGSFDLTILTWVFEHITDPLKVVNKAWERLRPGGHIILLFETRSKSWQSSVVDWIWGFFSARLVSREEYERFPGIVSVDRFPITGAPAVLITINKPGART